jgi:hypothetical protein
MRRPGSKVSHRPTHAKNEALGELQGEKGTEKFPLFELGWCLQTLSMNLFSLQGVDREREESVPRRSPFMHIVPLTYPARRTDGTPW